MPKKGYKSITVTDKLYDMIGDEAEARGLSPPGTIRSLLVASAKELKEIDELIMNIQNGGEKLGELTKQFPDVMKGSMAKTCWNDPTFTYGVEYGALIVLNHLKETKI